MGRPPAPSLVLGENGVGFASGTTTAADGVTQVSQIASFNVMSGAPNWTYQAAAGHTLSLVEATAGGGVTVNDSSAGVFSLNSSGTSNTSRHAPRLPAMAGSPATSALPSGAVPFDLSTWLSAAAGAVAALWSPNGTNGIPTFLAQSVYAQDHGNSQRQSQPPYCQRKNSNCVLAPNNDQVFSNVFPPGVNTREVIYELFSLQNGTLVPMGGNSQILQTKIMALETNPTNPASSYCSWQIPGGTVCVSPNSRNTAGWYTDDYSAGGTGPNTVSQQFFVDRGQVEIFWPTDTSNSKIWYGAVYQTVTDLPTPGATITQVNPNTSQGATCNLHPPDPHGCSPTQANGTN